MMHAAQEYYHMPPSVYSGLKMPVKREVSEDAIAADTPVDMSLSARDLKASTQLDIPLKIDPQTDDNEQLYSWFLNSFNNQQSSLQSQIDLQKSIDNPQTPKLENLPISTSSVAFSPGVNNFPIKDCEGKLIVPDIMTKTNSQSPLSDADLLSIAIHQRAKREFVPDNKKDDSYWCKRLKNNDSARRSRVKRKAMEKLMESKLLELQKQNIELKHEVAALRRRYGEEEGSSSDSSSSREKTSTRSSMSPPSPPDDGSSKVEDEQQSSGSDDNRSHDDSRVYSLASVCSLNRNLCLTSRDRTDSIGSSICSLTSSRISTSSRPNSRSSQLGCSDTSLRTDTTGALDLTSDYSNRSTPAWETSSSESCTSISTNSNRRNSFMSIDSNSMEDSNSRVAMFPLKLRWKKEMSSTHVPLTEELQ